VGLAAPLAPAASETVAAPAVLARDLHFPNPGEAFGHYRIVRLLGQGGMGAVFEAEDQECGRRVALKVLGHRLDWPEARSRFFREGRLAASVNHPNSVYVYGTEEIAGIPVIAMELAAGGTLQERVSSQGPLPAAEAVDCALQVIAGLEAAQRAGVLHRDIKPSNCFVDEDGTVKIGDFGLSISTLVRFEPSLTASGAFLGTPVFSSPEQLRGDDLTVRSDIYSVGVTLYYLLTGHHPFTADNLVQLLATVLERRPDSPAKWRPGLAPGLCRTVLRCLEKDPENRFRNYAELRAALLRHATAAPIPAPVGWRFLAACLDALFCIMALVVVQLLLLFSSDLLPGPETYRSLKLPLTWICPLALLAVNYVFLEGRSGASAGKAVCGLRVARLDRRPPGLWRAALRALMCFGPALLLCLAGLNAPLAGRTASSPFPAGLFLLESWALTALLFSTARRRSGFAAGHDLATGTRVVLQAARQARPPLSAADETSPKTESAQLIGPYQVLNTLGGGREGEVLLGFDARLLRRVWIRRPPPGTPPLPPNLRYLGRRGRLRWLNGRHTATETWDAYDAPSGKPLLDVISQPQCWSRVRYWLLDLTQELMAAENDGSWPAVLDLDRVWITAEGHARLLDFPAPGAEASETGRSLDPARRPSAADFIRQVAWSALEGRPIGVETARTACLRAPVALPARRYLESIAMGSGLAEVVAGLQPLLCRRATISRAKRWTLLAVGIALPLLYAVTFAIEFGLQAWRLPADPELAALQVCLLHHELLRQPPFHFGHGPWPHARESQALETYTVGRFGPILSNQASFARLRGSAVAYDSLRFEARLIMRLNQTPPSKAAFDQAGFVVERFLGGPPNGRAEAALRRGSLMHAVLLIAHRAGLVCVVVPCLVASLCFRGGLLVFALGIALVNRHGARASRLRVTARNLLAWLPFLLLTVFEQRLAPLAGPSRAVLLALGCAATLALISTLLPQRGLQDRLAGAWPVPR